MRLFTCRIGQFIIIILHSVALAVFAFGLVYLLSARCCAFVATSVTIFGDFFHFYSNKQFNLKCDQIVAFQNLSGIT